MIAFFAIMLNEIDYVDRWMNVVDRARDIGRPFDRVLVVDGGSTDGTVQKLRERGIEVFEKKFTDFSSQRNFGLERLHTDWIFELDADEIAPTPLLVGLRDIADNADCDNVQCVGFSRLNVIDGRLVEGPGHNGFDYQYRLHRGHCRWVGEVHEELMGWEHRVELPFYDGHFIVHDKTSTRHRERNEYYDRLVSARWEGTG